MVASETFGLTDGGFVSGGNSDCDVAVQHYVMRDVTIELHHKRFMKGEVFERQPFVKLEGRGNFCVKITDVGRY